MQAIAASRPLSHSTMYIHVVVDACMQTSPPRRWPFRLRGVPLALIRSESAILLPLRDSRNPVQVLVEDVGPEQSLNRKSNFVQTAWGHVL